MVEEASQPFPLSSAQQALWAQIQLSPGAARYNLPFALHLKGEVDRAAFREAWQTVLHRHDQLRARFITQGDKVLQEIRPYTAAFFDETYSEINLAPGDLLSFKQTISAQAFNLSRGPLVKVVAAKLAQDEWCTIVVVHHLNFDGASVEILLDDLATCYEAALEGREPQISMSADSYQDHVEAGESLFGEEDLEVIRHFWRALAPYPLSPAQLPWDRRPTTAPSPLGVSALSEVDAATRRALKALARQLRTSLFGLLLSAYAALLHRYGNETLCITAATSVRTDETRRTIGLFVNPVPVILTIGEDHSFAELVSQVTNSLRAVLRQRRVPLHEIVQAVNPPRSFHVNPLFQLLISYANFVPRQPRMGQLATRLEGLSDGGAKGDLALEVVDFFQEVELKLEGPEDLFERSTMGRILGHLVRLLEHVVVDPHRPLSTLPLLGEDESDLLLSTWNATESEYPEDVTVHELVEAQAERTPDAPAVVSSDRVISYADLNSRANQLAHYLAAESIGPDVRVAVCIERSPEMVVALLGILKAGAAYVPLDPGYPEDRLEFLLADASAQVLITQPHLAPNLPSRCQKTLYLDSLLARTLEAYPTENPPRGARSHHLAYVIYTSGSTGRPKGVMIEHRNLVNLITWHVRSYELGPKDRTTNLAGLGFDASVWELWPPLTAGASVWLPDHETRLSPEALWRWLNANRVTVTFLPTPLAEMVMAAGWAASPSLRIVLTGGDRLRRYPRQPRSFDLVNHYGPTECTVVATAGLVPPRPEGEEHQPPPIGRPIANTEVYVLDAYLKPVPIGVPGELYVGGAGVGRGYLNQPELTVERFVPNPFSPLAGSRLYRTGDLVRHLPDRGLEFLGRLDHQVKIRGFRIELGEIETVLMQCPQVSQAVVMVREDIDGEPKLVAYAVGASDATPSTEDLLAHLQRHLPHYMLPSAFVFLEALPLTPHGKLDRAALPAPAGVSGRVFVAPRTRAEQLVAGIWERLLGMDRIGAQDDFFELGGDSLRAVQVIAEVEKAFGRKVRVATLFEASTVEAFAWQLGRTYDGELPPGVEAIQPAGCNPPLFFVFPDEAGLMALRHLLAALGPEQPVFGLLPDRKDRRFEGSVESLAAGLLQAVRSVQPTGPYQLCGYSFGGVLAYELAGQLLADDREIAFLGLLDTIAPHALLNQDSRSLHIRRLCLRLRRLIDLGPTEGACEVWEGLRRRARTRWGTSQNSPACPDAQEEDARLMDLEGATCLTRRYSPAGYEFPLTLFWTWSTSWQLGSSLLGWKAHRGPLERCEVPGDHSSMLCEPNVNAFAASLADHLRRTQSSLLGS